MKVVAEKALSRKINKVKLEKDGGVLVEFKETEMIELGGKPYEKTADVPYKGNSFPHPDLTHAFELVRPHLAILCSQLDGRQPELDEIEADEEFIALFKVTGITIGGSGEHEGVTITGNKKIKRGILNLNSPFTKFEDSNDPYDYAMELSHLVHHLMDEADKYVDGKVAPNAQGKFDFEGGAEGDEESPI